MPDHLTAAGLLAAVVAAWITDRHTKDVDRSMRLFTLIAAAALLVS